MSSLRRTSYVDAEGRRWAVDLPAGAPDSDAPLGLHVGPQPLTELGLPLETEVRLHNQLFSRGILTVNDAKRKRADLFAALQAAYAVDGERLIQLYADAINGNGYSNGHKEGSNHG